MVADFTLEELGRFRLKTTDGKVSDQKIPTLEEVLMEFRGKVWFNLDKCMESDVSIEKVYDVVERCGCLDRVQFYISDDTDRADWLSRQKPQGIIAPHANKEEVLTRMAAYSPVYMIQTSTGYVNSTWISSLNAKGLSVVHQRAGALGHQSARRRRAGVLQRQHDRNGRFRLRGRAYDPMRLSR